MRTMIILLLAIMPLFLACTHLREFDSVDPIIHGAWVGEGRFYDRDLKQEYGKFSVSLEIHPDNSVSGTVGDATLAEGVIKSRPNDFLIEAKLTGPVFKAGSLADEKKDCVIFILEPPEGEFTKGDFHLKTNLTFDFTMRAGAVTLSRSP